MGKKRKKKGSSATTEEPAEVEEEPELTGFVQEGELYLRCPSGNVYSSERNEQGQLIMVGTWDGAAKAIVPLPSTEKHPDEPERCANPQPQRVYPPAPRPEPLAFEADELDHCETAPEAYSHVAPLLADLASCLSVTISSLRIYDPFFCNGAVTRHLAELGFESVYNKNEDFYAAIESGRIPAFDVLLTNPPYSSDHPERLLDFCVNCGRPWLILCPNWVYERPFFSQFFQRGMREIQGGKKGRGEARVGSQENIFFVVPRKRYYYWTPRGRRSDLASGSSKAKTHGHTNAALGIRTSPFISFWAGGGFPWQITRALCAPEGCMLVWRLEHLPPSVRDCGNKGCSGKESVSMGNRKRHAR